VSGDGGRGWVRAEPVPELPPGAERCYAPEIAFDGHGRLYFLFVGLEGLGNSPMGVFITSSTDRGRTFSSPHQVLGRQNYMVRLAIDPMVGGRSRIHLVWLRAGADPPLGGLPAGVANPILAAHSDDAGQTFSEPVQVSDPDRPRAVSPAVAVGGDGAVNVPTTIFATTPSNTRASTGAHGRASGHWWCPPPPTGANRSTPASWSTTSWFLRDG